MKKNNIVSFGLRNVHYSIATQSDNGSWSFATPVSFPGAQEFASDIIGGGTTVRADDIVVAQLNNNGGRTLTLKVTEVPDEFKIDVLKSIVRESLSLIIMLSFISGITISSTAIEINLEEIL